MSCYSNTGFRKFIVHAISLRQQEKLPEVLLLSDRKKRRGFKEIWIVPKTSALYKIRQIFRPVQNFPADI